MIGRSSNFIAVFGILGLAGAMLIPEDTEILPGYQMDDVIADGGSGVYFELRSLTGDDRMPIRNRRSVQQYQVLESQGLRSHFVRNSKTGVKKVLRHVDGKVKANRDYMQNIAYVNLRPPKQGGGGRKGRSVNEADAPGKSAEKEAPKDVEEIETVESLPVAARLSMSDDYPVIDQHDQNDQNEAGSSMLDSWHDGTYVYAKLRDDGIDSIGALASPSSVLSSAASSSSGSGNNEGMKGRMPRVHFITQKTQSAEPDKADSSVAKSYRSVPQKRDNDGYTGGGAIRSSASSRFHNYDVFESPTSYDGYDREMLLQPESYLRSTATASIDYLPTRPPTYADYFYSERRFDLPPPPAPLPPLPLYRDGARHFDHRHPDDRYLPGGTADMKPPRNRRIIYYATLPEIVRQPSPPLPTPLPSSYRSGYNSRYDYPAPYGGGYEYDRYYRSVRAEKPASFKDPASVRGKVNKKQFLDGSVRIASTLTVNDAAAVSNNKGMKSQTSAPKRQYDYGRYF